MNLIREHHIWNSTTSYIFVGVQLSNGTDPNTEWLPHLTGSVQYEMVAYEL